MGGAISVYSEEGKGTTFHILFPIHGSETTKVPDEVYTPRQGSGTILLVDDEEYLLWGTKGLLEHFGYTIISSNSSVEALEQFTQLPKAFNLVLTDLTMPDMTGIELAKHIKKIRPDIPIVLCTGFSAGIDKDDLVKAGISSIIRKPLILKELTQAIEEALNSMSHIKLE